MTDNPATAELRALDGRLLKLSRDLRAAGAPVGQINADIRRLLARRAELVKPRQQLVASDSAPFGGAR